MENIHRTTRPRFKRVPATIRLTERDLEIIRQVYKHRFLTSKHIYALIDGGKHALEKRLKLLFHAGFLDRPRAQLLWFGNQPMVYALGSLGADLMIQETDLPASSVDWTGKNREVKGVFLDHTLMVADFLIKVELACKNTPGLDFIGSEQIISQRPKAPASQGKALSWRVVAKNGLKKKRSFALIPDGAFGIKSTVPGKAGISYFFLEADRSTMPIQTNNLARSSFYKKLVGYWESWSQNLFSQNFGFKKVRVLTLTISEERVKSILRAGKELDPRKKGSKMFLMAPDKSFDISRPETILGPSWVNGCGETVPLID